MRHRHFLLAIPLCMLASCERNLYVEPEYMIDDRFMMQQPYEVPTRSGLITIVTNGEDTLAITDVPLTIQIPLGSDVSTRAAGDNGVVVTYADYAALPEFKPGTGFFIKNHTLLFEDSRQADYDYNDLVLHVQTLTETVTVTGGYQRTFTVKVRGLALGSTKQIGFGFTDSKKVDYDLTDNVRRDYFGNRSGFINTEKGQPFIIGIAGSNSARADEEIKASPYNYTIIHNHKDNPSNPIAVGYIQYKIDTANLSTDSKLNFYIKVSGEKFYVGEFNKNLEGALPYGIRTEQEQNFIPLEKTHIFAAFPEFVNWINGKTDFGKSADGKALCWNSEIYTSKDNCYEIPRSAMWRW